VYQGQFETWKQDPQNIHNHGNGTARGFRLTNFMTERRQAQYAKFEALDSEGNTNDGDTQQDATQDVQEADQKPAADKPEDIE